MIPQNNIKVKSFAVIARKTPLSSNRTHEPSFVCPFVWLRRFAFAEISH
jgi:hypothetical protein